MRVHLVNLAVTLVTAMILAPLFHAMREAAGEPVSWLFAVGYALVLVCPTGLWRSWQEAGSA